MELCLLKTFDAEPLALDQTREIETSKAASTQHLLLFAPSRCVFRREFVSENSGVGRRTQGAGKSGGAAHSRSARFVNDRFDVGLSQEESECGKGVVDASGPCPFDRLGKGQDFQLKVLELIWVVLTLVHGLHVEG